MGFYPITGAGSQSCISASSAWSWERVGSDSCVCGELLVDVTHANMNIGYFSDIMPLRMIWFSGLFRIIGGGDQVLVSNALTMVADMFSEEER